MSKVANIRRPPLEIVSWEYGCDLRQYGWAEETVAGVVETYKLKHRQAVIFFNNSKMFGGIGSHPPKCRIYWMWHGQALTVIPPVKRTNEQVDYQHDLNAWLRKQFGTESNGLGDFFDEYTERFTDHAARRRTASKLADKIRKAS